jgi:hypothetical protein
MLSCVWEGREFKRKKIGKGHKKQRPSKKINLAVKDPGFLRFNLFSGTLLPKNTLSFH